MNVDRFCPLPVYSLQFLLLIHGDALLSKPATQNTYKYGAILYVYLSEYEKHLTVFLVPLSVTKLVTCHFLVTSIHFRYRCQVVALGFEHIHSCSTKCNTPHKMEHARIAHGTTVGLSVPFYQPCYLAHRHPLLQLTRPGRPCSTNP